MQDYRGNMLRELSGAVPAVATVATANLAEEQRAVVYAARIALTTDGNAANRRVTLSFLSGASLSYFVCPSPVDQVASTTVTYFWSGVGQAPAAIVTNRVSIPAPFPVPIIRTSTFQINLRVSVENMQAGDQLTALVFLCDLFSTRTPG